LGRRKDAYARRFLRPFGADVLRHNRSHGLRTARCEAAGASPVATIRRPVGAKNGRCRVRAPHARGLFTRMARRQGACKARTLRGLCVRSPALPLFSFSLCILHSALRVAVNGARRTSPPAKWATVASPGSRPPPAKEFGFLRFNPQSAIRNAFPRSPSSRPSVCRCNGPMTKDE